MVNDNNIINKYKLPVLSNSNEFELFNLLKNHEYEKFISSFRSSTYINSNIKDNTNTYLIQYAILFKQYEITKMLLMAGAKIDFIDIEGRNILYIPIKFGYNEFLDILFNNKNYVGIPLTNLTDRTNNIAIHYAIFFNNEYAFDYLLEQNSNINLYDINGNNAMHYCIIKNNYNFLEKILNNKSLLQFNIDCINKYGESLLHVAINHNNIDIIKLLLEKNINTNIYDEKFHITALMYAIIKNFDLKLIKLLITTKTNILLQDYQGNTILHYSIINNNLELTNYIIQIGKKKLFNIQNIDAVTPLHLILLNILEDKQSKFNQIKLNKILLKTNLELQDNNGNTVWHYLAFTNKWLSYTNILSKKKNNLFIKNRDNKNVYDLITNNNKNLLDTIIINSYKYLLKKYPDKWNTSWEKECSINGNCDQYIIKQIQAGQSYPLTKSNRNYCSIIIEQGKPTNFITFTGSILDVIFGLIYLKTNYKNIYTSLTDNFKTNDELINYYKKKNIKVKATEYTNLEILWIYTTLFIPTNLSKQLDEFKNTKSKSNFFIIPLGIETAIGAHANIIIIDKKNKIIERFEPNGSDFPVNFNYQPRSLDNDLTSYFLNHLEDYIYLSSISYQPKIGFQQLESIETGKKYKIGDPGGFCLAWCFWYANMRLEYNKIPVKKLITLLIRRIREKNLSYKNIIRNYTINITNIRDQVLNSINSDINDYINGQLTNQQYNNLEKSIINSI